MAISDDNIPFTVPEKHDNYLVTQARNEQNEVIYEIQSPGEIAGWKLYKLQDLQVAQTEKFKEILRNNSNFVILRVGDEVKDVAEFSLSDDSVNISLNVISSSKNEDNVTVRSEVHRISPWKDKLYAIPENELGIKDYFSNISPSEKKAKLVSVGVPVGLSSNTDLNRSYEDNNLSNQAVREGKINASCIDQSCWFKHGSRRQIPKEIGSGYIGNYKNTYVWVPKYGRDQLAKLTLAVLDIAFNDSPEGSTTEVYALVGSDGKTSANFNEATFVAKATLPRGADFNRLMPTTATTASPPADAAAQLALNRLEELRLKFKQELVLKAKQNIFGLVNMEDMEKIGDSVDYVSTDYRKRSLAIRNDDYLIAIAADILSSNGEDLELNFNLIDGLTIDQIAELGEPELARKIEAQIVLTGPEEEDLIEKLREEIVSNARRFLDAEYQVQNTSGVSQIDIQLPIASEPAGQKRQPESSILRLEQNLRALGL